MCVCDETAFLGSKLWFFFLSKDLGPMEYVYLFHKKKPMINLLFASQSMFKVLLKLQNLSFLVYVYKHWNDDITGTRLIGLYLIRYNCWHFFPLVHSVVFWSWFKHTNLRILLYFHSFMSTTFGKAKVIDGTHWFNSAIHLISLNFNLPSIHTYI